MDEEIFDNLIQKLNYNIKTEEPNSLLKFLQLYKSNFTNANKFIDFKGKSKDDAISKSIRYEITTNKTIPLDQGYHGNITDPFINIAFKISDKFSIDEYLSCRILYSVVEHNSTRDENELINLSEKFIYQNRSNNLKFLKEILYTLQSGDNLNEDSKKKYIILQSFIGDLISETQTTEKNLLHILINTLEDKLKIDQNTIADQLKCYHIIKECIQIIECLFLISIQFTVKENIIKSYIMVLNKIVRLQCQESILKKPLFEMMFTLYFTIFSVFDNVKNNMVYNAIEKKYTNNEITSIPDILNCINEIKDNDPLKYSLIELYNTILVTRESSGNKVISNDPYQYLLQVVETPEFKSSQLNILFCSFINILSCKLVPYLQQNTNLSFKNNYNLVLSNIFENGVINSNEFWRYCYSSQYLQNAWMRIDDKEIISSFKLMSSLARHNTNEVFNFFAGNIDKFTWAKLFFNFSGYASSLTSLNNATRISNGVNGSNCIVGGMDNSQENKPIEITLSNEDSDALTYIFLLISRLVESSIPISNLFLKIGPLIELSFQFAISPKLNSKLKSAALSVITAYSTYSQYQVVIWRFINQTRLFVTSLSGSGSCSGGISYTQQSLELLLTLLHQSPYLFDKSNIIESRNLIGYLDQCMELFNQLNNKHFNGGSDEKWKFALTLIEIFEFSIQQFNQSIVNYQLDKQHPVYNLYVELNKSNSNSKTTLENIMKIIEIANNNPSSQSIDLSNIGSGGVDCSGSSNTETFNLLIVKSLDLLLLISDNTVYDLECSKQLVTNLTAIDNSKPIVSIAKLIDNELQSISLRSIRLIYSFETYTHRISTVFEKHDPELILEKFNKMMEYNESNFEDFSGTFYQQHTNFIRYASNSIQWAISQLIMLCLTESSSMKRRYTLAHFLLGCSSDNLSKPFTNSKTCLTLILTSVMDSQFVERYPHLVDCYHEIIYKMSSDSDTWKPMIQFINKSFPEYYRNSLVVLRNSIVLNSTSGSERRIEALVSSLSWVLKTCSISIQNEYSIDMKQFLSNEIFPSLTSATSLIMSISNINIISLYNTIQFQPLEINKPRIFSVYPKLLEVANIENKGQLNIQVVQEILESDINNRQVDGGGNGSNVYGEIQSELDECCIVNSNIQLYNSRLRALESWKSFTNISLSQNTIEIETLDESLLLSLLQTIVNDFSNERNPLESLLSIGYTILLILFTLKSKKENFQLFQNFSGRSDNNLIEQKMKSIFDGLLSTVLKSPHQSIRGITYTCLIQYLDLTIINDHSQENGTGDDDFINNLNINLISKIEDKFIRILSSDCNSFSRGWRITAISCLESILSIDNLCGHRSLLYLSNKGFIINMINDTTSKYLNENWKNVDPKDLHVYKSQMSLLLKISQQMDGVYLLVNNNLISTFIKSPFLNFIPTDKIIGTFSDILLPILNLFSSICCNSNNSSISNNGNNGNGSSSPNIGSGINEEIFNFILNHSDLFLIILSDNNSNTSFKSLKILKKTVFLFSKVSNLFFTSGSGGSNIKSQFNKFHYCLVNLLIKYSNGQKKFIELIEPENQDDELLAEKFDFSNGIGKQQSLNIHHHHHNHNHNHNDNHNQSQPQMNQFQVVVKNTIQLIISDLLIYCRKVSILSDSKFGTVCFNSNLNILNFASLYGGGYTSNNGGNGNMNGESKSILPSLDLAINILIENILQYSSYKMDLNQLIKLMNTCDQLTTSQYTEILQNQIDSSFSPTQRNHIVLNILKQKIQEIETQITLVFENFEILLILIVIHSYYFSNSLSNLFQFNNGGISTIGFGGKSNGGLEINDLSTSKFGQGGQVPLKTNESVFLSSSKPGSSNGGQVANGGVLSSVFSYFKGHVNTTATAAPRQITGQQQPQQQSQTINRNQQQQQLQLQQSFINNQLPSSELSSQDIDVFLKRLKQTMFERDINQLGGKLSDVITNINIDRKSTLIDLMLKKLQDLTK